MTNITEKLIQNISQRIVEKFHPEKIILFGSYAKGRQKKYSDIDLFIVMNSKLRRDERSRSIGHLFNDRLFPLDIIVYTPQELDKCCKKNPFINEILKKGKVLYDG